MALTIDPERLKQVRKARGLTQDELAKRARLNKQSVYRLEKSQRPVRKGNLSRLAGALEIEPGVLTGEEPVPDGVNQPRAPTIEGDFQLNVRVDGQIRNAFSLAALHYNVPVRRIVELAPLLFVLAAEASLKRRRDKLAELEAALDRASDQWWQIPHLPSSAGEPSEQRRLIEAEKKSIVARDLCAEFEFGHELEDRDDLYEHDSRTENPFAVCVRERAEGCDEVAIEALGLYSDGINYSVCWSEAVDLAGGDKRLAAAVALGLVPIHEIPRELQPLDQPRETEWTEYGVELRTQWMRRALEPDDELLDRVLETPPEWMFERGVVPVQPKWRLINWAGGDEELAQRLFDEQRSGKVLWRRPPIKAALDVTPSPGSGEALRLEMPEKLWEAGAEAERAAWLRRMLDSQRTAAEGAIVHTSPEANT